MEGPTAGTAFRLIVALAAAALVLACPAVPALAVGAAGPRIPRNEPTGTLYLLQAATGSLERVHGQLRLSLAGPNHTVTTFEDRPARLGGAEALRAFVRGWRRSFGHTPPNAALMIDRAPASHNVALLELRAPRYDSRQQTLSFAVRRLKVTRNVHLRTFARQADPSVSSHFRRSTLFIDSGPSVFGYEVQFTLFGPQTSSGTSQFSLSLQNSTFMDGGVLTQPLTFGQTTLPSISANISPQQTTFGFPNGRQLIGTFDIGLPNSGSTVKATVVLPPFYQLTLQSEAGDVTVNSSGPVSIPAPPPP
jgi:hypothetical protein